MKRSEVLARAAMCVSGEREQDYGSPEQNFKTISFLWSVYLQRTPRNYINEVDVAAMLSLLKIARIASGNAKEDNWVDLAGYAACGGELESRNEEIQEDTN